jgi:4-carboxymuconolactone decarboxylase
MTEPASVRMVPIVQRDVLNEDQLRMWDSVAGGARAATAVRAEGQLTGPFDVLLRSPAVGTAVADLGALLRYESSLDKRLTEVVILTVAGHWHAQFAWLRHAFYAEREGIPAEVVAAIAKGRPPVIDDPRDAAANRVSRSLLESGHVDDELYASALAVLGERTLVEVVSLTGYYCLCSFLLNTFHVPLPPGATVPWND